MIYKARLYPVGCGEPFKFKPESDIYVNVRWVILDGLVGSRIENSLKGS